MTTGLSPTKGKRGSKSAKFVKKGEFANVVYNVLSPTTHYTPPMSIDVDSVVKMLPELAPEIKPVDEIRSYYDLNWRSVPDLAKHISSLPNEIARRVRNLCAVNDQARPHKNNLLNGLLLALSEGYRHEDICECLSFTKHRYMGCDTWRMCPQCAYYENRRFVQEWKHMWRKYRGNIHFVTISAVDKYTEGYDMVRHQERMITFWNGVAKKVVNLMRYKKMDGVLYSEETAIISLQPLKVNPHVHMIVFGDFPAEKFAEYDVVVKEPGSLKDFENVLGYLVKSINLWSVYDKQWTRETAELINRQFVEFARGFHGLTVRRKQMRRFGVCHKLGAKKKTQRKAKSSDGLSTIKDKFSTTHKRVQEQPTDHLGQSSYSTAKVSELDNPGDSAFLSSSHAPCTSSDRNKGRDEVNNDNDGEWHSSEKVVTGFILPLQVDVVAVENPEQEEEDCVQPEESGNFLVPTTKAHDCPDVEECQDNRSNDCETTKDSDGFLHQVTIPLGTCKMLIPSVG